MKKLIRCFECDSEYYLEFDDGLLSDDPQFCVVCKEPIDVEDVEELELEDD
jgi:hypothetical protein